MMVATPYNITELSHAEERREIGNFMDCENFDVRGYHGEVLIEGTWHTVWQFGSTTEAERFAREWVALFLMKPPKPKSPNAAPHRPERANLNQLPPGLLSAQRHPMKIQKHVNRNLRTFLALVPMPLPEYSEDSQTQRRVGGIICAEKRPPDFRIRTVWL